MKVLKVMDKKAGNVKLIQYGQDRLGTYYPVTKIVYSLYLNLPTT